MQTHPDHPGLSSSSSEVCGKDLVTQLSLKNRLQRGRKVLKLLNTLAENILHAVLDVSVTLLHAVKLEDLIKVATGAIVTRRLNGY
jgi:hypothetical protein